MLTCLINNAGIVTGGYFLDYTLDDYPPFVEYRYRLEKNLVYAAKKSILRIG